MRISDDFLKCVGFVAKDAVSARYGGTAFIVGIPYDDRTGFWHVITAKHVADAIGNNGCIISMNGKDGSVIHAQPMGVRWYYHPTELDSVDVAVMPFASKNHGQYDIIPIPISRFATAR
jgi:hypothetical protein